MIFGKKIRYLGRDIKIIEKTQFCDASTEMGTTRLSSGEIIVKLEMPDDTKEETIFHELFELIIQANDIEINHSALSAISNNIYAILKDNNLLQIRNEGYTCDECGKKYKIDLNISNELWNKVSNNADGSGLLCPHCIINKLEEDGYCAFEVKQI